jgi:hypothetical protein
MFATVCALPSCLMRRLLFAAFAAAVGCTPPDVGPSLRSDPSAYHRALAEGDAAQALSVLDAHAEAGDLDALRTLADAHQRGSLRVPYDSATQSGTLLPFRTTRWQAGRALRRYERVLRDSARAGSHEALFQIADATFGIGNARVDTDADSARAVYQILASRGADPLRLAFLADRLGDEAAHLAHLDAAAEAGDLNACVFAYWRRRDRDARFSAAGVAEQIDALEACRAHATEAHRDAEMFSTGERVVRDLVEQASRDNAEAKAVLDSLRAHGVFERHPHLTPLVEVAARG